MIRFAFLFGVLLTAPAIAQGAPAAAVPAKAPPRIIPLYQSEGRVIALMRIGAGEPVPMVFDTGSDGNTIDPVLVRRHRLRRSGTAIEVDGTSGRTRRLPMVRIPGVRLGGLAVGTIEAAVSPFDPDDAVGIISSEIFTDSLVAVDLARSQVRLTPRTTATPPAGPATSYVGGIATIALVLPGGSSIPAHVDTGYDAALSLPVAMMRTVPLYEPAKVVGSYTSISNSGEVWGGRIRGTIRIGPLTLHDPEVSFLGDIANIGLPLIRQVTLVLDPAGKRSWVLPARP
ncbi:MULTISPECIES: aspartyl protease family protein [Sphingomonas]|uniref:aspartyl protease family protein n=1 Tax=Sphingomonas TaxID=13687 RepID=UPI000833F762|nr:MULTISPECIES: aspartyl protease family protein [Sphingomonas]